jgi:RNA polymerase sigma factor for flagellar operon FliA
MDSATGRPHAQDCPPALSVVGGTAHCRSDVTELVEHHLSLVGILVSERLRYVPAHIRRDDLMSAGMLALVLSAAAYDPGRGVPFQAFAALRIRGALIDELRAMDWASRSVRSRGREIETVRTLLTTTLGRQPGTDEIADAMGISSSELVDVYADLARGTVLSLQSFDADALPAPPVSHTYCPESLILRREQMGYLHDAIAALPVRLRFVVVAYFFEHRQMSDIAVELSVTQSRVSQMCTEATALIRDGMNSQLDTDALRPQVQTGRAAAVRNAYFRALAERSTLAGRLDKSTAHGDMRSAYPDDGQPSQRSRIA